MKYLYIALLFTFTATAQAQLTFEGDQAILVDADKATYKGAKTVLEGNVDVRQGEAQIRSDKMEILRTSKDDNIENAKDLGLVTRIDATGNFKYVTPENTVVGDRGVYERNKGIITVTGNVKLIQPSGSEVTGDRLVYNIQSKNANFGDRCVGANCTKRVTFTLK